MYWQTFFNRLIQTRAFCFTIVLIIFSMIPTDIVIAGSSGRKLLDTPSEVMENDNAMALGNCSILPPGEKDSLNQLPSENRYGITYKGYLINSVYYHFREHALSALEDLLACSLPDQVGECSILYPGQFDLREQYCESNLYTITYQGIILDEICYDTLEKALQMLRFSRICRSGIKYDVDQFLKSVNSALGEL